MSDHDLYISNGTCYYGIGLVADKSYIPCGNAFLGGIQACCFVGSYCLASSACWDRTTKLTYVAGCTDSNFTASKCVPKFDYPSQQYVSMARCDGSNIDKWTGCGKHPAWVNLTDEPNCECDLSKVILRNARPQATLDQIASLPTVAGGTISFNPTAMPTRATDGDGGETGSLTGFGSSTTAGAPTNSAAGGLVEPTGEMPTPIKIAIGVAVPVFAILVMAIIVLFVVLRRRKKAAAAEALANSHGSPFPQPGLTPASSSYVGPAKASTSSPPPPSFHTPFGESHPDHPSSPHSPAWMGYKAELAAPSTEPSRQGLSDPQNQAYYSHLDNGHGNASPGASLDTSGLRYGYEAEGNASPGTWGRADSGLAPSPGGRSGISLSPVSEAHANLGGSGVSGNGHDARSSRMSELQG